MCHTNILSTLAEGNHNGFERNCNFDTILSSNVVVSGYNKPNKLKNIYNVHSLKHNDNLNLFIDSNVCNYFSDNFKRIGFVNDDTKYFRIKKVTLNTEVFRGSLNNCKNLETLNVLQNDDCIIELEEIPTTLNTTSTYSTSTTSTTLPTTTTSDFINTTSTTLPTTTTTNTFNVTSLTTSTTSITQTQPSSVTTSSQTNPNTNQSETQESKITEENVNDGAKIGGVFGSLFFLGLILLLIIIFKKRYREKNVNLPSGEYQMEGIEKNENSYEGADYLEPVPIKHKDPDAPVYHNPIEPNYESPIESTYKNSVESTYGNSIRQTNFKTFPTHEYDNFSPDE